MTDSVFPTEPLLRLPGCVLRPYHACDLGPLRASADDPQISRFMRDGFPYPYTEASALGWLRLCKVQGLPAAVETAQAADATETVGTEITDVTAQSETVSAQAVAITTSVPASAPVTPDFALAVCLPDGTFAGGIGLHAISLDNTDRYTREIGYWIGRRYQRRGLATEAVAALARWALSPAGRCLTSDGQPLRRIEASVFSGNDSSGHVLQRAGFVHEGVRRQAVIKYGVAHDVAMYGLIAADLEATEDAQAAQTQ